MPFQGRAPLVIGLGHGEKKSGKEKLLAATSLIHQRLAGYRSFTKIFRRTGHVSFGA
jgi:hypothetical protein